MRFGLLAHEDQLELDGKGQRGTHSSASDPLGAGVPLVGVPVREPGLLPAFWRALSAAMLRAIVAESRGGAEASSAGAAQRENQVSSCLAR